MQIWRGKVSITSDFIFENRFYVLLNGYILVLVVFWTYFCQTPACSSRAALDIFKISQRARLIPWFDVQFLFFVTLWVHVDHWRTAVKKQLGESHCGSQRFSFFWDKRANVSARVCVLKRSIHPSHIAHPHLKSHPLLANIDLPWLVSHTCRCHLRWHRRAHTHKRARLSALSVFVLCLPLSVRGCNFYRTEALSEAENRHWPIC